MAYALLAIFLLSIGLIFAIRTPAFQTWLVTRVTNYLASEWHTKVEIDRIEIEFFRTLSLKGLYVEDQHHDTLIYAGEFNTVIQLFNPGNRKIYLSGVELSNATVKLKKYKNEEGLNLNFIVNYFKSTEKDTVKSPPFEFDPGEVTLNNVNFVYRNERHELDSTGMDYNNIRVEHIQAAADGIKIEEDTVWVSIENITCREKSGFAIEYFEASAKFTPQSMEFNDLLIKTGKSQIQGVLAFQYNEISDFEDFVEKVHIQSQFDKSQLASDDLVFFAEELRGLEQSIIFSGNIKGTIDQLRGKGLDIRFADHSHFRGDVNIAGLPDFNESFFDLVVTELVTDKKEIASIHDFPFNQGTFIQLPDQLDQLGKVRFTGKFTGFLNDFVAYGNATTALGFVSSDINLKLNPDPAKSSYSGHLSTNGFHLGALLGDTVTLGAVTLKADVKGSGMSLDKANGRMNGLIESIVLNGYNYQNISLDANMARRLFSGSLKVSDENLGLEFKGTIDLSHAVPVYDFYTEIPYARLAKLHLIDRDTTSLLATTANIQVTGKDFDELTGYIRLNQTVYSESNYHIVLDSLDFVSTASATSKKASIRSNLLDFDIEGSYRRTSMFRIMEGIVSHYLPVIKQVQVNPGENFHVQYNIALKNTKPVTDIFYPDLMIATGTRIRGEMQSTDFDLSLHLTSDSIRYRQLLFTKIGIEAVNEHSKLKFSNTVDAFEISDTLKISSLALAGTTDKSVSNLTLTGSESDSMHSAFRIESEVLYLSNNQVQVTIPAAHVIFNNETWTANTPNTILFDTAFVELDNVGIHSGNRVVSLSGKASASRDHFVSLVLRQFDATILNPVLAVYGINLGGTATGEARFYSLLEKPFASADVHVDDLMFYSDTLGNANINLDYAPETQSISVGGLVDRGGTKNIEVTGKYYIRNKNDSIDFNIIFQKTNMTAFSGYAKGLASDIHGNATGSLKLSGYAAKPEMIGKIRLQQASFTIDYLQTHYSLAEEVEFNKNYIRFNAFTLNDEHGNKAILDGFIYHNHFKEFILNLSIEAKNFQMLNTRLADNDMYYGRAYATGNVRIFGPLDLIQMKLALRTERNTQVYIPLSNPSEISKSSFINFVSNDSTARFKKKVTTDLTGIEMDFDLEVTSDAEIQLIFDSKIGDVIKGRGTGNLTMNINPQGDFLMYGSYQVVSGDYLFTLKNLINKKFIVTPGGTIAWNGSPYEARIDLEGVYKTKASLYDLMQDTSFTERVPVEVHLFLKDDLFNPNISFDIQVPDIDPTLSTQINRYIPTEQAKSTQTMSLLVLNRFAPGEGLDQQGSSGSGVSANAAEILSQQLSVWGSQISDVVNIGVNYRAGDAFSQEELEVALSTKLFNERVTVDSNVGVSDNNNNTSNLVGDFLVEVKVSDDGKFRFKAFNKTINNSILNNYSSPYTQGIGVFYRDDFNTFGELFHRFNKLFRKKEEPAAGAMVTP